MSDGSSTNLKSSQALYHFREFTLDAEACTLARGEELLPLPSKVFELLLLLVRNHDRVVTKQEIFDEVWAGATVEESNLTQSIFVLRKTLGHTNQNRFVATFPGKGYRFVAPVVEGGVVAPAPLIAPRRIPVAKVAVSAGVLGIAALLVWATLFLRMDPVDRFWAPVLANSQPAVICFSSTPSFDLGGDFRRRYIRSDPQAKGYLGGEALPIPPTEVVTGDRIMPVVNQLVGIGSAYAIAEVARVFATLGKPYSIEMAAQTTFGTMRAHPVVLIGAFNNPWTLELSKDARFVFESVPGAHAQVRDRQTGKVYHFPPGGTPHDPIEDYALVSRAIDRITGEPLVVIAGITQYGTRAASELVGSNALLTEAARRAPRDWYAKSLQVLLSAKVVKGVPARPAIVAVHVW